MSARSGELQDVDDPELGAADNLTAALAEARESGVNHVTQILARRDMLSAAEFAKFIGVSREAIRGKHQRHEVLGLKGAKRGTPFFQMASDI